MSPKKLVYFSEDDEQLLQYIDKHIKNFSNFVREQVKLQMMKQLAPSTQDFDIFSKISNLERQLQMLTETKKFEKISVAELPQQKADQEDDTDIDAWIL